MAVVSVIGVLHAIRLNARISGLTATVRTVQDDVENGRLAEARVQLGSAEATLTQVNSSLYGSPDFKVLSMLPVAKQNLDAVRNGVQLGIQLVGGGEQVVDAASPLESSTGHLDLALKAGQLPVATIQATQTALANVLTTLPASANIDAGHLVIGRIRSAEQRLYTEAVARRQQLTSLSESLSLINEIAGGNGDRRYLLAVANEAEMRGAGGMILSYGVLSSHAGKVTLDHFGPIDELKLAKPAPATFPADFTRTYGALGPNQQWRDATMMSDFTVDAPVLESMYTQATGLPVNGVIQVDSDGLGAVLAGTGPVATTGLGTVTAANVVPLTLNQAYVDLPDRPVRQEYLGTVADQVFTKLTSGSFPSLRPLGVALAHAVTGRHVLMWSGDAQTEATIRSLGADGGLPGPGRDFAQLTVQNFGGDKMDYYLTSSLVLRGDRPRYGVAHLQAVIDLGDTAPAGRKPAYIFGPANEPRDPPGEYRGLVTLYLPSGSYLAGSAGDATTTAAGQATQNGVVAVTYTVAVPPTGHSHMVLDLLVPPQPSDAPFVFVPTPRIHTTVATTHLS